MGAAEEAHGLVWACAHVSTVVLALVVVWLVRRRDSTRDSRARRGWFQIHCVECEDACETCLALPALGDPLKIQECCED